MFKKNTSETDSQPMDKHSKNIVCVHVHMYVCVCK